MSLSSIILLYCTVCDDIYGYRCNVCAALLTLSAIDGLGGVNSHMTDDETKDAEKEGAAKLFFLCFFTCFASIVFIYYVIPETGTDIPPNFATRSKGTGSRSITLLDSSSPTAYGEGDEGSAAADAESEETSIMTPAAASSSTTKSPLFG